MNRRTVGRGAVLLLGLLASSGCGPSKEEQAIDAYKRGNAYAEKGEFDKAIADYTEAIRLNPKFAKAYVDRGIAYVDRGFDYVNKVKVEGEIDKAIADLTEAIRLNPKVAGA